MPETGSNLNNFSSKFALVPARFFDQAEARAMLAETVDFDDTDHVSVIEIPCYQAVLVYAHPSSEEDKPEPYYLIEAAGKVSEHNKIVASYFSGRLYLLVAEDDRLLLCNSFKAIDFTTAEYFLFMVMKKFQLNPEISTIYFRTPLDYEQKMSLYRYFKDVEQI